MDKSPDAFRTITEVAEWLDTPAHVLRFWESRFSQIKPVKRAGGRRYYRPNDMLLLGGIKKLLHDDGTTIKGVQKILREQGIKHVQSLSIPVSIQVKIKQKVQAATDSKPAEEKIKTPSSVIEKPIPEPVEEEFSLSANRPRVKVRRKQIEPLVLVDELGVQDGAEITKDNDISEVPVSANAEDTGLKIKKLPETFKPSVDISPKDMQDIEAYYYSLKMLRNNMKRTAGVAR